MRLTAAQMQAINNGNDDIVCRFHGDALCSEWQRLVQNCLVDFTFVYLAVYPTTTIGDDERHSTFVDNVQR